LRGVFSRKVESNGYMVAVGPGTKSADQQQPGRIIALFSPKGGAGTTTIAVNLAVAIAELGKRVAFVDGDLQFGDAGVFFNLDPTNASMADVMAEMVQDNPDALEGALLTHSSGVRVLLAPPTPDSAELVTGERMRTVVGRLSKQHEVVVIDCSSYLNDATLAVLDMADEIISPIALDIPAIRSARVFVDVSERLGYSESKVRMIVNRADTNYGIRREDVERSVGRKVDHVIVGDARAAVHALNHGVPFVQDNKRAAISRDVIALAQSLFEDSTEEVAATPPPPKARLDRRLVLARR
jgi:pilus assembly protein CpaE